MAAVRIGVVGCGAIAQVHHLPNLALLQDLFEVPVVCDISPDLAEAVASQFHVPRYVTDYRALLDAGVDAVLLCHGDPKTEAGLAVLEAGKHLFIEKPVCFTLSDADAMIAAARRAGVVAQAGYMKAHDPAFELLAREVESMGPVRFIQVNHLHTDNSHHLVHFGVRRAGGLPSAASVKRADDVAEALGSGIPEEARRIFFVLAGSMIHDLYGLRILFGQPERVVSTEVWNGGFGVTAILAYASGARCAATWVELSGIKEFVETLEVYSDDRGAVLSYPTGFSRGIPSQLEIRGVDGSGRPFRRQPFVDWEIPFVRELRHFHACVTEGVECRTSLEGARDDVALVIDIVRAYLDR